MPDPAVTSSPAASSISSGSPISCSGSPASSVSPAFSTSPASSASSASSASPASSASEAGELFASVIAGEKRADPYPTYHRLREIAPLLELQGGVLALTRYHDCDAALRHRSLGKAREPLGSRMLSGARDENTRRALAWMRRTMLFTNPPDHTRLRRLVSSAFTAKHVEELRTPISERASTLLEGIAGQPGADFMSEVALPLPVNVIADLLGVPDADRESFIPLVHDVTALLEPLIAGEALARAVAAQAQLRDYFGGLLAEKRRAPSADLLSRLASSRADDKLDDEEMIAAAILLFGAGFETTTNLLGNGLRALLENPGQLELLRGRPGAIGPAVEEMLRYDSPIQLDGRTTLEPVTFAGLDLPAGELAVMLLGAANRDPARFTDPDRFDVTRDDGPHLAFASGVHFCLGAHLARLEAEVVFSQLLTRFPEIELAAEPEPRGSLNPRGLARLPVTIA